LRQISDMVVRLLFDAGTENIFSFSYIKHRVVIYTGWQPVVLYRLAACGTLQASSLWYFTEFVYGLFLINPRLVKVPFFANSFITEIRSDL